jgi:hypothetical protein
MVGSVGLPLSLLPGAGRVVGAERGEGRERTGTAISSEVAVSGAQPFPRLPPLRIKNKDVISKRGAGGVSAAGEVALAAAAPLPIRLAAVTSSSNKF